MSLTEMTRTISTSEQWKTMSNKPSFGRDAEEFLRLVGINENKSDKGGQGIRITALVPSSDSSVTVRVSVDGTGGSESKEFVLLKELCASLELSVGDIDGAVMPEIEYYADVTRAYFSACASFAYAPSSLRALEKKLVLKGFERDVAQDAIFAVRSRGFVDEADIAFRRAQLMVGKLWGRNRIIAKLREEGFDGDTVTFALRQLSDVDFAENCAALIRKKYRGTPSDASEKNKMLASLSRFGYTGAEIRMAIDIINKKP